MHRGMRLSRSVRPPCVVELAHSARGADLDGIEPGAHGVNRSEGCIDRVAIGLLKGLPEKARDEGGDVGGRLVGCSCCRGMDLTHRCSKICAAGGR